MSLARSARVEREPMQCRMVRLQLKGGQVLSGHQQDDLGEAERGVLQGISTI